MTKQLNLLDTAVNVQSQITATNTTTFAATLGTVASTVMDWNWTAIIMCTIGIVSAVVNLRIVRKKEKRDEANHKMRMMYMRKGIDPDTKQYFIKDELEREQVIKEMNDKFKDVLKQAEEL